MFSQALNTFPLRLPRPRAVRATCQALRAVGWILSRMAAKLWDGAWASLVRTSKGFDPGKKIQFSPPILLANLLLFWRQVSRKLCRELMLSSVRTSLYGDSENDQSQCMILRRRNALADHDAAKQSAREQRNKGHYPMDWSILWQLISGLIGLR